MRNSALFGSTYTKIGTIQRLAWPLRKDNTQIHEAFHIKKKKEMRNRFKGLDMIEYLKNCGWRFVILYRRPSPR